MQRAYKVGQQSKRWILVISFLFLQHCINYTLASSTSFSKSVKQIENENYGYPIQPTFFTPIAAEFTTQNGSTYQVIQDITLSMAQEVQNQTGLVIPFAAGKTNSEFVIGKGNFGEVRLGKDKSTGQYVGIKIIHLPGDPDKLKEAQLTYSVLMKQKLAGITISK